MFFQKMYQQIEHTEKLNFDVVTFGGFRIRYIIVLQFNKNVFSLYDNEFFSPSAVPTCLSYPASLKYGLEFSTSP